jgi:hypothetical protein
VTREVVPPPAVHAGLALGHMVRSPLGMRAGSSAGCFWAGCCVGSWDVTVGAEADGPLRGGAVQGYVMLMLCRGPVTAAQRRSSASPLAMHVCLHVATCKLAAEARPLSQARVPIACPPSALLISGLLCQSAPMIPCAASVHSHLLSCGTALAGQVLEYNR